MSKTIVEVSVTGADKNTLHYSYDKGSIMIGRAAGNDLCIDVVGVSRYHARLSVDGNKIVLEDLGSTNGTFLNSDRVTNVVVTPQDTISIGPALLNTALREEEDSVNGSSPSEPAAAPAASAVTATTMGSPALSPATPPPEPPRAAPVAEPVAAAITTPIPPASAALGGDGAVEHHDEHKAEEHAEHHDSPHEAPKPAPAGDHVSGQDFYWQSLRSFLSPVWDYILDDSVTEILINGPAEIFYEKKGQLHHSNVSYNNDQLKAAVLNIAQYVGRRVSEEEPYLDARLPDGSRVAIMLPPCSRKGISISIRKFSKEKLTMDKLLEFGSISPEMVMYLRAAVTLKKNIIVSGGTSSGKTSLLNVVSSLIPGDERILTIEDSAELQLSQEHVLPLETKPPDKKGRGQVTIRDLVKASLRMRPDRIIVGEIRGGEALDLLQAMNTGHSGSMATVHASSPKQALTRMETLSLFSGLEIPMRALREQVSTALEVIVQASRLPDHSRKVVYISEVNKLSESGDYQVTDIFKYSRTAGGPTGGKIEGKHIWTGAMTGLLEEMELAGMSEEVKFFKQKPSV